MIDVSAVARVVGIDVQFQDLRGGAAVFLPQHIAVFAQGSSTKSYSLDKWPATSATAGGNRYGFGSAIHNILRQLFPADGDGVGTIPVTVYPLEDAPGSVAASGTITPSGTATAASSWRVRVAGVLSSPFVLPAGVVDVNGANGKIGAAINSILEMPVVGSWTYGALTQAAGATNVGNGTVSALSVSGTPTPGVHKLKCTTAVANGGVFTLTDASGTAVGSVTLTVGSGMLTPFTLGGITGSITDGTTDFAVGDEFSITVPATATKLAAKWKGTTGNEIVVEMIGDESVGVTFVVVQPTGGLVDPDVTTALAQVGNVWVTMIINGNSATDATTLDIFKAFGESRWNELAPKPLVVFTGTSEADVVTAKALPSARKSDRINSTLPAPGCVNLPCVIAANQVAMIARLAQNNPPSDYGSQRATRLLPGPDAAQWNAAERELAVKGGCSTTDVRDGVVCLSDVVTFYRPTGEEPPAYAYVCDIVKLQQVVFNIGLIFNAPEWAGAPLIPDDQPTVNPRARKPKTAVAAICGLLDSLALNAIIVDAKTAKSRTHANINPANPKRLDVETTVQIAGNSNIISVTVKWGFYFGTGAIAA